jgi:hypothetical protein
LPLPAIWPPSTSPGSRQRPRGRGAPYSGPYSPKPSVCPSLKSQRRGMKFLPRRPLAQRPGDPCISAGAGQPRDPLSLARINVLRIDVRTGAAGGRARYETPAWTPMPWRSTNDACRTHAALSSPLTARPASQPGLHQRPVRTDQEPGLGPTSQPRGKPRRNGRACGRQYLRSAICATRSKGPAVPRSDTDHTGPFISPASMPMTRSRGLPRAGHSFRALS